MRCQKHDERSYGRMLIATAQPPFDLAEDAVGGDDDVVEEHLGELAHAVDHLERCDGDPRRVHVDEERGDAAVARLGGPGAREQHAAVGVLRQARPHLLAVDRPTSTRCSASPSGTARQLSDARSLPVPGSEKPWHHISAPESRRGTTSAASSGGAKSMSVGASTSISEKRPGSARSRAASGAPSSVRSIGEPPSPPTRSGQP